MDVGRFPIHLYNVERHASGVPFLMAGFNAVSSSCSEAE